MRSFPECHSRGIIDSDKSLWFCAHPLVHTANGLVFPSLCHACTRRLEPEPKNNRDASAVMLNSDSFNCHLSSVAVVIPSHNYGRYLAEAIESVLGQSIRPAEVVVVNDSSSDDTCEVAASFRGRGVSLISIDAGNVHVARRVGFEATNAQVVCFLDADDCLPQDYLELGMRELRKSPSVGIVHSNIQCFGDSQELLTFPEIVDSSTTNARNFLHAGSLVRRDALMLSGALDSELPPEVSRLTADWWMWKKVLEHGWKAVRQPGLYRYRRHGVSALRTTSIGHDYYRTSHLDRETVSLFVPLSGRLMLWPAMRDYLEKQTWPRDQCSLVLLDTSDDKEFAREVRKWSAECDYKDARYVFRSFGSAGLADFPRRDSVTEVRRTMAKIYNFMARQLTTRFVWVLEDDVFPPYDVCERLLRQFDGTTGSVSAAYRSRYHDGYIAWDHFGRTLSPKGSGVQTIGGNGFGCVVIRAELFRDIIFTANAPHPDFDHEFYARIRLTNWKAKIHWDIEAEHRSDETRQAEFASPPV